MLQWLKYFSSSSQRSFNVNASKTFWIVVEMHVASAYNFIFFDIPLTFRKQRKQKKNSASRSEIRKPYLPKQNCCHWLVFIVVSLFLLSFEIWDWKFPSMFSIYLNTSSKFEMLPWYACTSIRAVRRINETHKMLKDMTHRFFFASREAFLV